MAQLYFGKGISVGSGFDLGANLPLDNRTVAATIAERDTIPTIQLYKGLQVFVQEDSTVYVLVDFAEDGTTKTWNKLASTTESGSAVDIVDGLTSTRTDAALSANQGKVLDEKITAVTNSLSSVYSYKGSVDSVSELPTEGVTKGDVYNVVAANGNIPAGTNYAWNGTEWDPLGGSVDLSGYYTKTEADAAISTAVSEVSGDVSELGSSITALTNQVANKVDKAEGYGLISDTDLAKITTNTNDIENLTNTVNTKQDELTPGEAISIAVADTVSTIDVKIDPSSNSALSKSSAGLKLDLSSISGTTIKVGQAINEGATISADDTVADALTSLAGAISSAAAGGITDLGSTDQTITVSGTGNTRNLSVKIANLIDNDSALVVDTEGKLTLTWEEIE